VKLILVRHGETFWNEKQRIQGCDSDIGLNNLGIKQAESIALYLRDIDIAAITTSPLKRALDTAQMIAQYHNLSINIDNRLKEIAFGDLEGLFLPNLHTTFSKFLMRWWQRGDMEPLPEGESFGGVQTRAWKAVEAQISKNVNGITVIVSHYFVIMAIILKSLGLSVEHLMKFKLDPGSISIIEIASQESRLVTFNSVVTFPRTTI